jgi:hypothetical protein
VRLKDLTDFRPEPRQLQLRRLARNGLLAETVASASAEERTQLRGAAYNVTWPVVFIRVTRRVELNRGHLNCYNSVHHLADGCLDAFHDDVEASVEDLLVHSTVPILDLEAWIASRLNAVTIDAYRRRRGRKGALQRPRPPKWLLTQLGNDPWLIDLATQILIWVGIEATAGASAWPYDGWAARRATLTADLKGSTSATVSNEVELVLAAMRQRPKWFARYVEAPMDRKQPAVGAGTYLSDQGVLERAKPLVTRDETEESTLLELAAAALAAITRRLANGEDPDKVVREVVEAIFCGGTGGDDIDRIPQSRDAASDVSALLHNPTVADRVVAAILAIIADRNN